MAPTLHIAHQSAPSRAVLMAAKAINLTIKVREVNLYRGELETEKYLNMNPQHTVPLLEDAGFVIWDSHAIMAYLVSKYGKDDSLYPKDLKRRALIDQRLHFESGILFPLLKKITDEHLFEGITTINDKDKKSLFEAYRILDSFLDGKKWMTGDSVTISDYSLISTMSTLHLVVPVDPERFPRVVAWMERCQNRPEYQENLKGLKISIRWLTNKL